MIPEDVAGLIRSLRSLWAIELLLFLHRSPTHAWQIEDIVRELRSTQALVDDILARLVDLGLVLREAPSSCRYQPSSPKLATLVAQLGRLHAERPLAIAQEIHGVPDEKLRAFSDAFKLKKD